MKVQVMLHISHSLLNVWDSRHSAIRTSYQDAFYYDYLFPSPSTVQSHFCSEVSDIYAPLPHHSPKTKANSKQWKLCHLSLCCYPPTERTGGCLTQGCSGVHLSASYLRCSSLVTQQRFMTELESHIDTGPSARLGATNVRCTTAGLGETKKR